MQLKTATFVITDLIKIPVCLHVVQTSMFMHKNYIYIYYITTTNDKRGHEFEEQGREYGNIEC